MQSLNRWRMKAACLTVLVVLASVRMDAQEPPRDAAYWRAQLASMKPGSTIAIRLNDGARLQGRLVATTADEIVIHAQRSFRRGSELHISYEAVTKVSRTHPHRGGAIGVAIGMGLVFHAAATTGRPDGKNVSAPRRRVTSEIPLQ